MTRGAPQIVRADQVVARPLGHGEGCYGQGRYGGVEQVVVDINPGDFRYVENVVDEALAFLEDEMRILGV